jgi:hypothetical protein
MTVKKEKIAKATVTVTGGEKWSSLVEELLKHDPCLVTVKRAMKGLGLEPGGDLVDCMEKVWLAMEAVPGAAKVNYEL